MSVTEEQINRWATPPSETENQKCENAVSQISDALRSHFGNDISFIRQGSHKNRTNVKLDSDIDIAVVHNGFHFADTTFLTDADRQRHESERVPASYAFSQFKTDVHSVLQRAFGAGVAERKNKCIRVSESASRVNADVVPAYEHVRYSSYGVTSDTGIAFVPDGGSVTYSFPEQHYANGVKKNDATSRAYKAVVRILKHARNDLSNKHILRGDPLASFFIESLVWNVPNTYFSHATYREDASSVALKIWQDMRDAAAADKYAEVSDLKWLLRGGRTPKQAEDFILQVWAHIKD